MIVFVLYSASFALIAGISWLARVILKVGPDTGWFLQGIELLGNVVSGVVFQSLGDIAMTLFYYVLRVRKEAYDLDQRLVGSGGDRAVDLAT
jgi:hypothetical protein